jgi:hypothetical protein
VQNNGAVPIAAEQELDFGCTPTPDSNNTIAEVLNGRIGGEVIGPNASAADTTAKPAEMKARPKAVAENGAEQGQQTTTSAIETTNSPAPRHSHECVWVAAGAPRRGASTRASTLQGVSQDSVLVIT